MCLDDAPNVFVAKHFWKKKFGKKIEMDFEALLNEYVDARFLENNDAADNAADLPEIKTTTPQVICSEFRNLAASRKCRFGKNCMQRSVCTYHHGETDESSRDFCNCSSVQCDRPHPKRQRILKRKRSIVTMTTTPSFECLRCKGPHKVTECPWVKCYKCSRYGHLANNCII